MEQAVCKDGRCHLHSNMERFKELFELPLVLTAEHLHSNMERFKVEKYGPLKLAENQFTFQYGEI